MMGPCAPQHPLHPKCRPGKTKRGEKPWQLRDGRWRKDDGNPALAFIGVAADADDDYSATVWVAHCKCREYGKCPLARALARAIHLGYPSTTVERRRQARGKKLDRVRRRPRRRRR